jgi:ribose transport system substrate-binding protein
MLGVLIALSLAVAACGGDDSNDGAATTPAATSATTQPAGDDAVAQAKATVEGLYEQGSYEAPPATSPPPQRGKNVWSIVAGLAAPGQVLFADGAKAGAKEMGWDLTTFDGKFDPSRYAEGVQQAIADRADGIILYTIDCNLIEPALKQAKAAKIPIASADGFDCNEQKEGKPSYFDAQVTYTMGGFADLAKAMGKAEAEWIIAKTDGKAKLVYFHHKDLQIGVQLDQGFRAAFAKCTTCEMSREVEFLITDLGPKLQEKAQQALLQTPDANAVMVPYDDLITAGVGAAVKSSGRNDELNVIGGGGFPANMDVVRKNGGQDAGYAFSAPWEGWAAVDTLNRVLAGQEPEGSGIGLAIFDREVGNLPATGPAVAPFDFAAAYKKAWSEGKG